MEFAMNPPHWMRMSMNDEGDRRRGPRHPWAQDPEEGFGPHLHAAFGPRGPFGPGGPFGPNGPFGPGGPFGPERGPRGRVRRGDVRQAILALLAETPMNGYQVIQALEERTLGAWKPSPGAVYPALSQLEDERLIESFDNGGQRAFRLTAAGKEQADRIATKPWEAMVGEEQLPVPEAARALWHEFGALTVALKAVTRDGNPANYQRAAALLADAKRKLYGMLAGEPDLPNGDDLR